MNDIKDHSQNMSKSTHHGKTTKLVRNECRAFNILLYESYIFFLRTIFFIIFINLALAGLVMLRAGVSTGSNRDDVQCG